MAWEFGDSFDFYNAQADMTAPGTMWSVVTGGGFSSTTRFGVGQSMDIGASGTNNRITNTFNNDTTLYVNLAYYLNAALPMNANIYWGFAVSDGANKQVGVYWNGSGAIIVTAGEYNAATLATWSSAYAAFQWNHYQFKFVINNTTGSVELRLNGATSDSFSLTGANTRNGSTNNYGNNLRFYGGSTNMFMDDFYGFNDQGAQPNTWQGDVRAVQLMPNSDSSVTWTKSTGASNNSCVSELKEDGDTTYVSTNTANNVDLYGIAALATTPNAIINVVLKSFARMDDAGPHTYKQRLSSGGTTSDGSNLSLSTSYQWSWTNYLTDPHTSAAWTFAGVNAALIGPFDVA